MVYFVLAQTTILTSSFHLILTTLLIIFFYIYTKNCHKLSQIIFIYYFSIWSIYDYFRYSGLFIFQSYNPWTLSNRSLIGKSRFIKLLSWAYPMITSQNIFKAFPLSGLVNSRLSWDQWDNTLPLFTFGLHYPLQKIS